MATKEPAAYPRSIQDCRIAESAPPGKLLRNRCILSSEAPPKSRMRAQALRRPSRDFDGCAPKSGPAEQALSPMKHDAVSLMHFVLDAIYEGGAHLAYTDTSFWHFDRTHWGLLSEKELGREILAHLASAAKRGGRQARGLIREVIELLKMQQATGADRARLGDPLPVINVANGELWIGDDGSIELRPHNPASGLRYCLDVVYDPTAVCPLYDRALVEIFALSENPTVLVEHWHEIMGYTAQPARPDARIFVGWGRGNDGKTALAGLLIRLLGRDRVASMPVERLAANPFMLGHLADKTLFLDDDVTVGTILPDGLLKKISEDKVVTGEPKHRDAFEFRVRTVPMLLCNEAPHLHDTSHGFRRRIFVIPFDRCFEDAEADRTLFTRIWAEERSGVLNRSLAGLRRVVQRGWKFAPSDVVVRATEAWWAEATGTQVPNENDWEKQPVRRSRPPAKPHTAKPDRVQVSGQGEQVSTDVDAQDIGPGLHLHLDVPLGCKSATVNFMANGRPAKLRFSCDPK